MGKHVLMLVVFHRKQCFITPIFIIWHITVNLKNEALNICNDDFTFKILSNITLVEGVSLNLPVFMKQKEDAVKDLLEVLLTYLNLIK
jgi:hypothetical protein